MTRIWIAAAASAMLASPTFSASHLIGDPAAGENAFNQCQTCHVVRNPEGEVLAGRNAKTGPNLYGIVGRQAGSEEEFAGGRPGYRDAIVEAGEKGLVWDQETIAQFLQDPSAYLSEYLGESSRSGMAFKVRSEDDAKNFAAFLATFSEEGS